MESAANLWGEALAEVRDQVDSPGARAWIDGVRPVELSSNRLVVAAPSAFAKQWVESRYRPLLDDALAGAAGRPIQLELTVDETLPAVEQPPLPVADPPPDGAEGAAGSPVDSHGHPPAGPASLFPSRLAGSRAAPAAATAARGEAARWGDASAGRRPPAGPAPWVAPAGRISSRPAATAGSDVSTLNPRYTFDSFVIGPSNRFAHAAALAVAEQPASGYNPLFVYGEAGLGKTHLLHAIGQEVARLYPAAVVRYVSSEEFMNDFIQSVRSQERMPGFRRRYREADVLLIDDIQFLARGEQTQEEFFHTFNALHNEGRQIVISSDRAPKAIAPLEDRLRTRFEWGLITDVQPPDLETRLAILQKKAAAGALAVPADVLAYIASRVQSNIRELEGCLIRVVSYASLSGVPATLDLAQEVLRPLLPHEGSGDIPPDLIVTMCAEYYNLSREDLTGPSRTRHLVSARQVAMYLCREMTPLSLPRIGAVFGGRDHTTVMHADAKIRKLMGEKRTVYTQIQELTARIRRQVGAPPSP